MSAVLTRPREDRQATRLERVGCEAPDVRAGGRLTLEQRLDSVWEGLRAGGAGVCPVCQAGLGPSAGAATVRCRSCGSVLF